MTPRETTIHFQPTAPRSFQITKEIDGGPIVLIAEGQLLPATVRELVEKHGFNSAADEAIEKMKHSQMFNIYLDEDS